MTLSRFTKTMARLDRRLAEASGLSRREAQQAIRAGRVSVAGDPCADPASKVPDDVALALDGVPQRRPGPRYLMLHKPAGYVCATRDDRHPTVLELLPAAQRDGLHVVGRLDLDTTGLLLLTDDGAWSHRITSPRHRCDKRYRVTLAEPLAEGDLQRLRDGVQLRGEARPTAPADAQRLGERELWLTLREGRYHQVKRMLGALGNRVTALHRDRVGELVLDTSTLSPGEFRDLTQAEVAALG